MLWPRPPCSRHGTHVASLCGRNARPGRVRVAVTELQFNRPQAPFRPQVIESFASREDLIEVGESPLAHGLEPCLPCTVTCLPLDMGPTSPPPERPQHHLPTTCTSAPPSPTIRFHRHYRSSWRAAACPSGSRSFRPTSHAEACRRSTASSPCPPRASVARTSPPPSTSWSAPSGVSRQRMNVSSEEQLASPHFIHILTPFTHASSQVPPCLWEDDRMHQPASPCHTPCI